VTGAADPDRPGESVPGPTAPTGHADPGRIWRGVVEVPGDLPGSVATIGVFDGVHRGHQAILARVREAARAEGVPAVAITFDPNPLAVIRPEDPSPPRLTSVDRRIEELLASGADAVLVLEFTEELAWMEPEAFVRDVLVDRLHVRRVVVGANFRFGHRAAGDTSTLAELGRRFGFTVDAVPLIGADAVWSSSAVRAFVAAGDVRAAAGILGRPHRVEGEVVHGDHRGRELGYPTANLRADDAVAVPVDGVYSGWLVRVAVEPQQTLPAAISVGSNPTFGGRTRRVEAYALDRDDLDLYGEHVAIDFVDLLRPMRAFDSVSELVAQMADDVARARRQLA
jgi:riboflavin kinase / FMN adenylyltransferase